MFKSPLPWYSGGLLLAISFFAAILLVKPIGVSTQFVIADGLVWNLIDPTLITQTPENPTKYTSTNAYLNKSGGKYAKNIADPLNYSFIFVVAMMFGAFISAKLGGEKPTSKENESFPNVWKERYGSTPVKRYIWTFLSGFIVLFGARLAGGCTSGHMMSGMMQTAVSGYLFAAGAFITAIPLAIFLYNTQNK